MYKFITCSVLSLKLPDSIKYLIYSIEILSHFHNLFYDPWDSKQMGFLVIFFNLIIFDLIVLWYENIIQIFQNLLRLALRLNLWSTLLRFLGRLKNNWFFFPYSMTLFLGLHFYWTPHLNQTQGFYFCPKSAKTYVRIH